MGIFSNFFKKVSKNVSTNCFFIFFEQEVPKSLREE